ncbi:eukaryotic translation initiation factor 3 subunit I-like [Oppia nitens]|uniref:eukaryotic translation initiation factor 3 subunit I-like n=1 Tax=Oppia nitens TaxID=1686743 RepID=UPI0023D982C1|nr:eukaryotic translation initiation factor 3 subunit I-like [Oppia nitens]
MKPYVLHGHERAITQIKYNREGDLLFSAAKDSTPNVWYTINGERLGTFDGHQGVVWSIDPNWDTTRLVTGGGDSTLRIWDIETGKELNKIDTNTSVRSCSFSYCGKMILYTTDQAMKMLPELHIIDITNGDHISGKSTVMSIKELGMSKVTSSLWGQLDESIITGHESGHIVNWELRQPKKKSKDVFVHKLQINDLQYNSDQTMFISASKDTTAKLFNTHNLEPLKTYQTERPVNSAAVSPIRDHVVLGGGQEAMEVTTTAARSGKFEARFFHTIFEEEFGRVKGHFGPIQSLAFHPDGKSFSSGGEDGYVRIQAFDSPYFDFKIEC